ncbi:MAG: aminotransferase class I/II-fold pyridoxal phosphate-dependent enzyme [Bacteroidales bacterium]
MFYNKLTDTTKDLFSIISDKAKEYNAINLVQPENSECPEKLSNLAHHYIATGYNHYAPPYGVYPLREQIARKVKSDYEHDVDPYKDITITAGANQAVYTAISSFVSEDDEVIVFEPAYKSYVPSIQNLGGRPIYVPLKLPDYHIDWTEVQKVISSRTKMLIINSPHNPTGTILSNDDLLQLKKIVNGTNIRILSDEVFEHFIFGNYQHQSLLQIPELYKRSIIVSSFGKLFNIPGWKIGYCIAPENLTKEIQKTHTFQINSVNTPLQYAMAEYLKQSINKEEIKRKYEKKRTLVQECLSHTNYELIETKGTYFQLIKYDKISNVKDTDFVKDLMNKGVALFPLSFYYHDFVDNKVVGLNFAHPDEHLIKGLEKLAEFK